MTPYLWAIPLKVSPDWTVYVSPETGVSGVTGVTEPPLSFLHHSSAQTPLCGWFLL